MNIANALNIDGWMRPEELTWLAQQASTRRVVVEVGSWMGRSTRAIADNLPEGGVVYAVDTWNGTPGPGECAELLVGKTDDWLVGKFIANIGEDLLNRRANAGTAKESVTYTVRPFRGTSLEGARYLCAGDTGGCYHIRPDMIFIDAGHDYDSVRADIAAWLPYLAPGGLMCGHDFGGPFAGVTKAVMEAFPNAGKVGAGSIWRADLR